MNSRQLYQLNTIKPAKNPVDGTDKDAVLSCLVVANTHNKTDPESDLKDRFNELKAANSRLEKREREQSANLEEVISSNAKFLSIIAHDLRSPFSSIIGVLELLKDSYEDYNAKEVERYIMMATNAANGTLNLLDNLLSWSTAQNNAVHFNPVKINLQELIINEVENLRVYATHKLITLNQSIPAGLYLFADQQMVKTILRNLINNAIKYSFIGGDIMVSAFEDKHFIEIAVVDNGIGIKHKAQKELLINDELHSTRGTNNENGTGLGLIICKEFVEKHGGTIWIESEPGVGTKVKFSLPCYN